MSTMYIPVNQSKARVSPGSRFRLSEAGSIQPDRRAINMTEGFCIAIDNHKAVSQITPLLSVSHQPFFAKLKGDQSSTEGPRGRVAN